MKKRLVALSIGLLILTSGVLFVWIRSNNINSEDIIGVWRTENYALEPKEKDVPVAIYVTEDGNLFVFLTRESSDGPTTSVLHYHYEIVDNQIEVTPVGEGGSIFYRENIQIEIRRNEILLDMREVIKGISGDLFILTLTSYEIPFGWSIADMSEIEEVIKQIESEIMGFAETFSKLLEIPIQPEGRVLLSNRSQYFRIGDWKLIEIAFRGWTPSIPLTRERHTILARTLILEEVEEKRETPSACGKFILKVHWSSELPEEWFDAFAALDSLELESDDDEFIELDRVSLSDLNWDGFHQGDVRSIRAIVMQFVDNNSITTITFGDEESLEHLVVWLYKNQESLSTELIQSAVSLYIEFEDLTLSERMYVPVSLYDDMKKLIMLIS